MVTNSRKASVSIVAGTVLKREDKTRQLVLVRRPSELVFAIEFSAQCSFVRRIQEASSAIVVSVIVTCVAALISIANKSGNQSKPSSFY
jgi:hypothetical protein